MAQPAEAAVPNTPVATIVTREVAAERLMAELERLQALPSVALEVIQTVDDPNASVRDVDQVVSKDPTVAARLFKLANSAFYARGNAVTTINDAVRKLGFKTIRNLAVAACAGKALSRPMNSYPFEELGLWKHSLGLALAVRTLATEFAPLRSVRDELFLAGLMHDVGKLVLDPILADTVEAGTLTLERETALAGLDHQAVGLRIAESWNLPAHTAAVINNHHQLDPNDEFATHAAAINVADYILNAARFGLCADAEVHQSPDSRALSLLELDRESLAELEQCVIRELPEVLSMCDALRP